MTTEYANTFSILNDRGIIEIAGLDAAKFMQGQFTCNMKEITATSCRPGAGCTPKGRMYASFRAALVGENHYLLGMHHSITASMAAYLKKYIVFSKATLQDASANYCCIGLSGELAATAMGTALENVFDAAVTDNGIAMRIGSDPTLVECWIKHEKANVVINALRAQGFTETPAAYWNLSVIRAGLGEVRSETVEAFVPQMINLHLVGGVSFNKGCYTGQEIVARMHWRGQAKRAMFHLGGNGAAPLPGTAIQVGEHNANEHNVGEVVCAENADADHFECLAVLSYDAAEHCATQPLHINAQTLQLLPLPYAVQRPEQEASNKQTHQR